MPHPDQWQYYSMHYNNNNILIGIYQLKKIHIIRPKVKGSGGWTAQNDENSENRKGILATTDESVYSLCVLRDLTEPYTDSCSLIAAVVPRTTVAQKG